MNKITLSWVVIPFIFIGCNSDSTGSSSNLISNSPTAVQGARHDQNLSESKAILGDALFHDTSLSKTGTMSCATCHSKTTGFVDERSSSIGHMAGASSDGASFGDRNVPTASYASLVPKFHAVKKKKKVDHYVGGLFLDGRALNLKEQAKGPFLNPVEMQMENETAVVEKVKENENYITALKLHYGETIFDDDIVAYDAIADAIANFEKTEIFAPFDSKYDRSLTGDYNLTDQEAEGLALFANKKKGNCTACHPLGNFTDFTYDNLGVPVNTELRLANGKDGNFTDHGLLDNPAVSNSKYDGAFRVSSLRNIAVTAPYMHNGIFSDLKTVIHFYNTRDINTSLNPETDLPWRAAEVPATVNHDEMGDLGLTDTEEEALVAFLKTLTDKRFEK